VDELDLSDESPSEKSEVRLEVNGWNRIKLAWSVHGRTSWVPAYNAIVLLLALVSAFMSLRLLSPGATWVMKASVATGTGGAVIAGGAALLYFWFLISKR
jgi:hypothetical protein